MELISLFAVSFLAATVIPAQSEALLSGLYLAGSSSGVLLIVTASAGNILGACVNMLLGRYLERLQDKKWFPVSKDKLDRAAKFYRKYGVWTLLLAWVPIIGDPITVIAGFFKARFSIFLILVSLGKVSRYAVIIYFLSAVS